jgi:uncharacterized DUF497 family protein
VKIEWDPKKARLNLRKHKVSFEEAATALSDPMAATGADPDHSIAEELYITFAINWGHNTLYSKRIMVLSYVFFSQHYRLR